ncbi:PTS sugar transporter subunit IIC [Vagococcus silagei]|uniref:PTS transporter subunit IIC n=1 Tax=Vagococcus silagei TaxID=2508885 RepID=A0A4S3B779_9ENTE|nr:PTS sugar transporter subunit IIC [Vagococcus silagei]THB62307.1 PTS transporter subunit IIC [Vagococcus silagei]
MYEKVSPKEFFNKVLAGTATGIIVGLIPNAVLAAILGLFGDNPAALFITHVVVIFQVATPLLIGALIALQFGFAPLDMAIVAGAAYVGSGVTKFNPEVINPVTKAPGMLISAGTGDLINTMITASLAIILTYLIGNKLGSVKIVLSPILIGAGSGLIGLVILPYISYITTAIGNMINSFTNLQPLLMSALIASFFAVLIISPISTVAIGLAIQLNGVSAGAAAMGVAATTIVLVVHSWKTNKSGITIAIAAGAMKMMMPNLFRYPIILLPTLTTAIISSIPVALLKVSGTAQSAGFGLVGLVGPLKSMDMGDASINIITALIVWFAVPIAAALLSRFVFGKMLHLYDEKEVFAYLA